MEKQKRWQLFLIIAVIFLTVYNILPDSFLLHQTAQKTDRRKRSNEISLAIMDRVDQLEGESVEWLHSFCKNIGIKPLSVVLNPQEPQFVKLTFKTAAGRLAVPQLFAEGRIADPFCRLATFSI